MEPNCGGLVELWGSLDDGREWHLTRHPGGWSVDCPGLAVFGLVPLAAALAWVREVTG